MTPIESVCAMAWDAYRLAHGLPPRTFPPSEIVRWMLSRARGEPEGGAR